jgi:hypothetical protein
VTQAAAAALVAASADAETQLEANAAYHRIGCPRAAFQLGRGWRSEQRRQYSAFHLRPSGALRSVTSTENHFLYRR